MELLGSLVNPVATHGADVISAALVVGSLLAYVVIGPGRRFSMIMRYALAVALLLGTGIASFLTHAQHFAWTATEIGKLFLPPVQPWSYFVGYVGLRFWLPFGLATLSAGLWYGFARLIRSRSERYLAEGELELTTLMIFAVGWPGVVVLMPVTGIFLVLVSLTRKILFKQELTTLGLPFILGALMTVIYAEQIRTLFGY